MDDHAQATLKRIETPLRLTLAGLWAERIVRAFWPLWTVVIAALAALSFGVQDQLPLEALWFGAISLVVALIWAAAQGLWRFRSPTRVEALARLDSRLPGQPLAALRDSLAIGAEDPASQAVWAAHLARMAARAQGAKAVEPDLKLAGRDPFALRYVALLTRVVFAVRMVWTLLLAWWSRRRHSDAGDGLPNLGLVMVTVLCGVRGSLENPQTAETKQSATADSGQGKPVDAAPKPHRDFILDGLIR